MTNSTAKTSKNRASLNLLMGLVGLVSIILLGVLTVTDSARSLQIAAVLVLLPSLAVMFFTRKSDEYTLGLWSSGANAAFAVIVFGTLFLPFFEGVYDGFNSAHDGSEPSQDLPAAAVSVVAILAFYLTFNIKRLTGAL